MGIFWLLAVYIYLLLTDGVLIVFDGIYHFTAIQQGRKYKNLLRNLFNPI